MRNMILHRFKGNDSFIVYKTLFTKSKNLYTVELKCCRVT